LTWRVISRTAVERETKWRVRRARLTIGEELRRLRLDCGVSLRELGAITGIDASHIARIEKGAVQASLPTLVALSTAFGTDMSVRFFAGAGPRIHDRLQAPMLDALIRELASCWLPRLEVVVPGPRRGVADIVLTDRTRPQSVIGEAQSEFRRIEQQLRWIAEKAKAFEDTDSGDRTVSRLLIVRSTVATRDIARQYAGTFAAAYPARTADVVDALTRGAPWPGDGMVWMRLERGAAELLPHPPRGVPVGR
jgi:transcriptional regulator with XRE-family HTH domain